MPDMDTVDRSLVRQIIIEATSADEHFWLGEQLLVEVDKLPIFTIPGPKPYVHISSDPGPFEPKRMPWHQRQR